MVPRRAVALLAAALFVLGACSAGNDDQSEARTSTTSTTTTTPGTPTSSLSWRPCDNGECATLSVPLDETQPDGEQIELALAREPAGNPDLRLGSLVLNPGGPGAPGAEFAQEAASRLPEEISDRFDIVGWDPRGSGNSSPVDCGARLDYLFAADTAPDDAAETAALEGASRRFAQTCDQRSAKLIRNVATIDTVHDLDRIREALGDDKLTYLGLSYGTYIGALYAQEYPDRVRAMVLDGAVDPAVPLEEVSIDQAQGFEHALDAFLEDCADDDDCAFDHDGDPREALDQLRVSIDRNPLRTDDGRVLGPTQFDLGLAAPLYAGDDGYDVLAEALQGAEEGDADEMLELFDGYVGRTADGRYSPEWPAFIAISCADGPVLDPGSLSGLAQRAARAAPTFGATTIGLTFPCSFWPVPPVNTEPTAVHAPDAPPLLVVGTTGDPATPIEWAEGLAGQLGSGRLVTVDGTAHTSSLSANPCLDDVIVAYVVRLRPPPPGRECPA